MEYILQNLLSKADLLIVFVGMALLQWRVVHAMDTLSQLLARQAVAPSVPVLPGAVAQPPPLLPKPVGPFAEAPPWFQWALKEIGTREGPGNTGSAIQRYIDLAHTGSQGDPWCAIFANAALESCGVPGSRSASSQSFRTHPAFVHLPGPALGAIAVFWRGTQDSGLGHVGFYRGEDTARVWTLGGNENDMVQIEALPKSSSAFGLIGYWWPKSVPLPAVKPVMMPTGSPVSIQGPTPAASSSPVVDLALADAVKDFEGFSAKAYSDFKQYSIGYGTKANSLNEVITKEEAVKRLAAELAIAEQSVEKFAPNAPRGVKQALTSLTYNAGPIWQSHGLGELIKAGNYETAKKNFLQYNHAGGQVNAGLTKRREAEVVWFDSPLPVVT